jgi:penicillin-binding protein 1A
MNSAGAARMRRREEASGTARRQGARASPGCLVAALCALSVLASACGLRLPQLQEDPPPIPALDQTSVLYDDAGHELVRLHAAENRTVVPLSVIPTWMRQAVVAIEDERFFDHHGVDVKAMVRAAVTNARSGRIVQGGSTITQQLVKNTITGDDRTYARKLREAVLAYKLEDRYSKAEILERYLNTVYFGQGAYGIQAAAEAYFSRPTRRLTLPQSALLAGLVASPSRWDPLFHPGPALARRNQVLAKMLALRMLDPAEYLHAIRTGLELRPAAVRHRYPAAYFVDYVKRWFLDQPAFGATYEDRYRRLFAGGLRIHTTVDLPLQRMAQDAVRSVLPYPADPYGAMTVVDPRTGRILAMVGGRDYFSRKDPYAKVNLATGQGGTGRQAGSAFKPFTLVAAMEQGISVARRYPAPGSIDIPVPGRETWHVSNYDGGGGGEMTVAQATIESVNTVYAQLIMDVGPSNVVAVARRMGMTSDLRAVPSAVLGTNEVNTLEMASAFGTLAAMGTRVGPIAVTEITDAAGRVLYRADPRPVTAVPAPVAWQADQILRKVVQEGTGTAADIGRPAAGKTGTAQEWRDAWFVGFVPQLAAAVWVGFPRGQISMVWPRVRIARVAGGTWPAEIWRTFMLDATRGMPVQDFVRPESRTVRVAIDATQGCLPNEWTLPGDVRIRPFVKGTEPTRPCARPDGPQNIPVPTVVGLSQAEATAKLAAYRFEASVVTVVSTDRPPGTVLEQAPVAGARALQGTTVTLTVAGRLPPVPVPAVTGLPVDQAVVALGTAGFSVAVRSVWQCSSPSTCGAVPGQVWGQSPSGGSTADRGSTVTIWVNAGLVPPASPTPTPTPTGSATPGPSPTT